MTPRTKVARVQASDEHGRRSLAGEGTVPPGARARRAVARRRRAELRPARRQSRARSSRTSTPAARTSGRAARASAASCTSTPACTTKHLALIYSAYPGAVGISRKMEAFGQRDEATMIALRRGAGVSEPSIGRRAIETALARARNAADRRAGKLAGVTVWTSPKPELRAAVVSFQPARSTPTSSQRRCTRRTRSQSRRAAARIAVGFVPRRISTTVRPRSIVW